MASPSTGGRLGDGQGPSPETCGELLWTLSRITSWVEARGDEAEGVLVGVGRGVPSCVLLTQRSELCVLDKDFRCVKDKYELCLWSWS